MKRVLAAVGVLAVLVLLANVAVGGGPRAMVDAARARCAADGLPAEQLKVERFDCSDGRFGFGGRGVVEFRRGGQPTLIRVELTKPANLLGWRVVRVDERGD